MRIHHKELVGELILRRNDDIVHLIYQMRLGKVTLGHVNTQLDEWEREIVQELEACEQEREAGVIYEEHA